MDRLDARHHAHDTADARSTAPAPAPGKTTRTAAIQRKATPPAATSTASLHADRPALGPIQLRAQLDEALGGLDHATTGGATGGGAALPDPVRQRMESSFGADFADVRVHQGGEAAQLGAAAYTQGNDLHFAPGRYDPGSAAGQELLGHELTHVVQQRAGRVAVQGKDAPINDDPALEREADQLGALAARGEPAHVQGVSSGAGPQRRASAPIQRYRDVGADEARPKPRGGEQIFTSHAETPTLGDDPLAGVGYARSDTLSAQGLIVSDDGTMAAQKGVQAQEFFAQPGVVARSNEKLEAARTTVRLVAGESSVKIGDDRLAIVKPTIDGEVLESLLYTECVEVANTVMGSPIATTKFEAILQNADDEEQLPQRRDMELGDVPKVASYVLDGSRDTTDIAGGIDAQPTREMGKEYGKQSGRGNTDDRAREMGINEYARPDVGEAFVAYSVRADNQDKTTRKGGTDYTRQKDRTGPSRMLRQLIGASVKKGDPRFVPGSWDMHYGGVVAVSADGADRVTLEDYNRGPEIQEIQTQMRAELEQRYAGAIEALEAAGADIGTVPKLITALLMRQQDLDWGTARDAANRAVSGGGKSTWYFRMYGTQRGQTFHDVGSAGTVNPLTMRLGRREEE